MVHAIQSLKCKNGHYLPISFDSNECGCHHEGKPTIIIICNGCLKESLEEDNKKTFSIRDIEFTLDEEGMKVIKELLEK